MYILKKNLGAVEFVALLAKLSRSDEGPLAPPPERIDLLYVFKLTGILQNVDLSYVREEFDFGSRIVLLLNFLRAEKLPCKASSTAFQYSPIDEDALDPRTSIGRTPFESRINIGGRIRSSVGSAT